MKTYVVNLEQDTERRKHIEQLCCDVGLDYEIINAVYGKTYPGVQALIEKTKERSIQHIGRELAPGEIGCVMSHQIIYKKIIDQKIPYALVLEDDIDLTSEIINISNKVESISDTWDVVLVGYHGVKSRDDLNLQGEIVKDLNDEYKLIKLKEPAHGTYGYFVSNRGAKRLLEQSQDYVLPIDHYTGDGQLNSMYAVTPQCAFIHNELSDISVITEERIHLKNEYWYKKYLPYFEKLRQKVDRTHGKIIIYGLNGLGEMCFKNFSSKVSSLVDKNKAGKDCDNKTISNIENLNYFNETFLITAIDPKTIKEIERTIKRKFNDANIVSLLS